MKSGHFSLDVPNDTCRRLNPQVFSGQCGTLVVAPMVGKPAKRIRQESPENKLEQEYHDRLQLAHPGATIYAQAIRLQLANGIWYKVDLVIPSICEAWEVKGPHAFRGGFENLKMAARVHPWLKFHLVWKHDRTGEWQQQDILP